MISVVMSSRAALINVIKNANAAHAQQWRAIASGTWDCRILNLFRRSFAARSKGTGRAAWSRPDL